MERRPQDHYRTLGVATDASSAELRAAYLRLAKQYHPDGGSGLSQAASDAKMAGINEAYTVLGDRVRRDEYDRSRADSGPGPGSAPKYGNAAFRPFDGHGDHDDFDFDFDFDGGRPDLDLDPRPLAGSRTLPRWVAFAPVALVAAGIVTAGLAVMVSASGLFGLAVLMFVAGLAGFVVGPLIAMSRAARDPYLD